MYDKIDFFFKNLVFWTKMDQNRPDFNFHNFFLETPCAMSNVPSLIKIHFLPRKSDYVE